MSERFDGGVSVSKCLVRDCQCLCHVSAVGSDGARQAVVRALRKAEAMHLAGVSLRIWSDAIEKGANYE